MTDTVVLVAEDEPLIAELVREVLSRDGCRVLIHTSRFSQLLTPEPWEDVTVAVVDFMLPDFSGDVLLRYLTDAHPAVRRVCFTAAGDLGLIDRHLYDAMVTKPGSPEELIKAVHG